jgi:hypothetical protein
MMRTRFHPGGYNAQAVAGNMAERWSNGTQPSDAPAGYTSWDPDGVQTSSRPLTAMESTAFADQETAAQSVANGDSLRTKMQQTLVANATYLALTTPTTAQTTAQVARNTKAISGIARLLLGQLDDITGT